MTDETRPTDGRTPSDLPEPSERPEFLPATEQGPAAESPDRTSSEQLVWGPGSAAQRNSSDGAAPSSPDHAPPYSGMPSFESPASGASQAPWSEPSSSWGDPSGRPQAYFASDSGSSAPPYGSAPNAGTMPYSTQGGYGAASETKALPPPPPQQAMGMGAGWAPPPGPSGAAPAPGRRGPSTGLLVALAVIIALVASLLGSVGTYLFTRSSSDTDPAYSLGPAPTGSMNREAGSVAMVAARVLPSVVSLEVGSGMEGASGSGFLIKGGYIVTNNHVVAMAAKGGGSEIRIMFNSRKSTNGRIVGRDPSSDLAVVKPEETFGTPEIVLGNSDQVVVGDPVIAIGSPLGLTGTVTTGIVSSLNRPVVAGDESGQQQEEQAYISAIQTDAAINPGNSGGPLVNGKGEVVGVNSAIATLSRSMSNQSGSIGLGFAIPVNQTRRVTEEIVTTGKAKKPKIGIVLDTDYKGQGVRIATDPAQGRQPVDADGPAGKAGLKPGDVILEMDGLRLQDGVELIALIRSKNPGAKINIKYSRDGQEKTTSLTVVAEEQATPTPTRS